MAYDAIVTKYLPPRDTKAGGVRGARVRATWGNDSIMIVYPGGFMPEHAHQHAARQLLDKLERKGYLHGAYLREGTWVFVFVPTDRP